MKGIDIAATALVIVGAINWGLVGLARVNLVTALLGDNAASATVFAIVGLAGLYLLLQLRAVPRRWALQHA